MITLPQFPFPLGASGSGVRISCSGDSSKNPTIAEEAVDQLQENEKLVAGKICSLGTKYTANTIIPLQK